MLVRSKIVPETQRKLPGGHKKAAGFRLPGDTNVDDLFDAEEPKDE